MEINITTQSLNNSSVDPTVNESIITNVQSQPDLLQEALRLQAHARSEAEKDIAAIKAKGHPIYYSDGDRLIRENADGQKFYYEPQPDGTEIILEEVE
jgi:hypothetical protein